MTEKRLLELKICWTSLPIFYTLFGVIFVLLTHVMPPPSPGKTQDQIVAFFHDHRLGIQVGFGLLIAVMGMSCLGNGLVAYHIKRMSVSPLYAYTYLGTLAVGAIPGCLFCAFFFLAATFRPERDPHLIALLYDLALLTFVGSLGCFASQYVLLAVAILLDRNGIFPRWMAYVSIWNAVTELLAGPVFVFHKGPFAWNGLIAFWEGTVIFGVYLGALILLLKKANETHPAGEVVPA